MNRYELLLGDCLEKMQGIPDGSVDMVLCDLPYGVTANKADVVIPFEPLWREYKRIIKENGCIALFAQGRFYVELVASNPKMFRYDLVWDKVLISGFLNANRMPLRRHEQIAIFYKKLPIYNPVFSTGKPVHGMGKAYLQKARKGRNYGEYQAVDDVRKGSTEKYPSSIIRFQKLHSSVAKHRTEKPVRCLEYLIKTYTNPGETVLDNCMGSGSTGVACANTDRRFIGIELDEKYFNIAKEQVVNAYAGAEAGTSPH